jgi:hypothetical protein
LSRFLKEPLLHFALAGAALFVLFDVVGSRGAAPVPATAARPAMADTSIVIDEVIVARLRQGFDAVWNRPPTEDELGGLIDSFVTEEILVREALALGLDADDSVVRQRLRLKMEFLLEAAASGETPDDSVLAAYLRDNADRFARAPRIAFSQVFLGEAPAPGAAQAALDALRGGADPGSLGQRSLLPPALPASPPQAIDGTFGRGVFEALAQMPDGLWTGPVPSGYGQHLVRVDAREAGTLPPLDAIRDEVERAWRADRAAEARDARLDELRDIYTVDHVAGPRSGPGQ